MKNIKLVSRSSESFSKVSHKCMPGLRIVKQGLRIEENSKIGFGVKPNLNGDSTLLKASSATNFKYQIVGFRGNSSDIYAINNIETKCRVDDRLEELKKLGGELKFISLENEIFMNNLILSDSLMPNILAEVIKQFYTSGLSTISSLSELISAHNPLGYDTQFSHPFYEYKIKRFLTDLALGMIPSKVWDGSYNAIGGHLIGKEDGGTLCYHLYNRNQFEDYLFQNTKLETASSNRHEFGKVILDGEKLYFKLNLQIRFI